MKTKQEFTVLRTFNTTVEAALTKALLDSADIDNFITNDATSIGLPMLNEGVGIKLMVRTGDLEKAEEFLNAQISKE